MLRLCFLGVFLGAALVSCEKTKETKEPPVAQVGVEKAVQKDVPYVVRTVGNIKPINAVAVRPQVSGELIRAVFPEGGEVKQGDLLCEIDPRPYEAALEEAQGQLEQAKAELAFATQRVERYKGLLPEDFVSKLDYEGYVAEMEAAEGAVLRFEGAVRDAEVNLGFCLLRAPIGGICSQQLVNPGNILAANQEEPLLTINQLKPINSIFTVAEGDFTEIAHYQRQSSEGLDVKITLLGNTQSTYSGKLNFIENQVNTATGTLMLRAIHPNETGEIWPGQFVHVEIELYTIPKAILIPEDAVQYDTKGPYIYVAKSDGTVELRQLELGQNIAGKLVVKKGVSKGEEVVVTGQIKLRNGAKYEVATPPQEKKSA